MHRPIAGRREAFFNRISQFLLGVDDARIELRFHSPILWLAGLIILAVLLPDRVWTTFLAGLAGLILIALFWARDLARGLTGWRRLRFGWVAVGDRLEEEFELLNRSSLPALWVEIRDESDMPGYQAAAVRAVGAGDRTRWRQASICRRRGQYHLGPWEMITGDPFGIFRVIRRYEERQEIIIHPPIHNLLPIPLPPGRSEGRTRSRERSWQATVNAATVREYHDADPLHWIHWPTTARKESFHVRQFEQDAAGDIWLVIDCLQSDQLGEGMDSTEEHSVLIAASLAARAAAETRGVGLAAFGDEPQIVTPGLGQGQQWRILRSLALLQCDGVTDLPRSLRELNDLARRGSAAIIITPSSGSDWLPELNNLARQGIECHVILLDRLSFGGEGHSESLRRALLLLGFNCQIISRGTVGRPIVEEDHRGFWEFKITGTGKAVAVRRPMD
ncbi:MAG: DUF58 domain-containing protein [Chloroflexota bacterium]